TCIPTSSRVCTVCTRGCLTTRPRLRRAWRAAPSARPSLGRAAVWWKRSRRERRVNMSHVDDGTLHAYLDGELSPVEAHGVEAHVGQCRGCRRRVDRDRALT